ncbi:Lrp/AsnC family transcriptional regulator [Deinococcus roseus]|uniref:AsnC family transcriptional regulator n=1 Tax=Deinococcus roseus TaxID=392414 RepID=A0ABQ2CW03_9DEIO|nr:Lrp/AsnC family transcriptional regulator [Deinococcus roseus]GGJ26300.1 AsnC family transcriptional regulator [Deinococcus roseus]
MSLLDETNQRILTLLQQNARLTHAQMAREVGLTAPSVAERIRKLEDAGIIENYTATINPQKLGYTLKAFIHLTCPATRYKAVQEWAQHKKEIREIYHVLGQVSLMLDIQTRSIEDLETLVQQLSTFGTTETTLVFSTLLHQNSW